MRVTKTMESDPTTLSAPTGRVKSTPASGRHKGV
jgi:hypothetical protein